MPTYRARIRKFAETVDVRGEDVGEAAAQLRDQYGDQYQLLKIKRADGDRDAGDELETIVGECQQCHAVLFDSTPNVVEIVVSEDEGTVAKFHADCAPSM